MKSRDYLGVICQNSSLSLGSEGKEVSDLQAKLGIPVTGYFDKETKEALMHWQIENDLPVVGVFGPQSKAKMDSLASSSIETEKNKTETVSSTTLIENSEDEIKIEDTPKSFVWWNPSTWNISKWKIFNFFIFKKEKVTAPEVIKNTAEESTKMENVLEDKTSVSLESKETVREDVIKPTINKAEKPVTKVVDNTEKLKELNANLKQVRDMRTNENYKYQQLKQSLYDSLTKITSSYNTEKQKTETLYESEKTKVRNIYSSLNDASVQSYMDSGMYRQANKINNATIMNNSAMDQELSDLDQKKSFYLNQLLNLYNEEKNKINSQISEVESDHSMINKKYTELENEILSTINLYK